MPDLRRVVRKVSNGSTRDQQRSNRKVAFASELALRPIRRNEQGAPGVDIRPTPDEWLNPASSALASDQFSGKP